MRSVGTMHLCSASTIIRRSSAGTSVSRASMVIAASMESRTLSRAMICSEPDGPSSRRTSPEIRASSPSRISRWYISLRRVRPRESTIEAAFEGSRTATFDRRARAISCPLAVRRTRAGSDDWARARSTARESASFNTGNGYSAITDSSVHVLPMRERSY